jgi:hypothetical protein
MYIINRLRRPKAQWPRGPLALPAATCFTSQVEQPAADYNVRLAHFFVI